MKKTLLFLLALGVALAGCYACMAGILGSKRIKGSGKLATKTVEVGAFDAIDASNAFEVTVVEGSGPVTIQADDNIMQYVSAAVRKGTLVLGLDSKINNFSHGNLTLEARVPAGKALKALRASGASQVMSEMPLTAANVELSASGASKLVTPVECSECKIRVSGASAARISGSTDACDVDASGASKIEVSADCGSCLIDLSGASKARFTGSARICQIDVSGASKLQADAFVTKDCIVDASGASKAEVNCSDRLKAQASSASKIIHTGGSRDNAIRTSGAGSISEK